MPSSSSCYYCVAPMDFPEELYNRCLRHVRKVGDGADEEVRDDEDEELEMETEPRPIVTTDVDGKPLDIKMRPRPKVVNCTLIVGEDSTAFTDLTSFTRRRKMDF